MYFSIVGSEERKEKIKRIIAQRQSGLAVVLEDISDPHNVGAVIRTAEAFGISDIRLIFNHGKMFNPRKVGAKTSSYANKWVEFQRFKNTNECLKDLRKSGYEIIATALSDDAESIFSADLKNKKIALLFGNEHAGLSQEAINYADRTLIIPMRGMVQSFNISVTAGLTMYEVTRQRIAVGLEDYLINEVDQKKLFDEFKEV